MWWWAACAVEPAPVSVPLPPVAVTALAAEPDASQPSLVRVRWSQDRAAQMVVEFEVDPGVWRRAPPVDAAVGDNEALLVGLPYGALVRWRVVGGGAAVDGPEIAIEPLPNGFPEPELVVGDGDGPFLLGSVNARQGGWVGGTYWLFVADRRGRIVWARATPDQHWTLYAQVAVTGDHILYDEQTYWSEFGRGETSAVHAIYLDQDIGSTPTPGLHHAFIQMPDQSLVWGSRFHRVDTEVLMQRTVDGVETALWSCADDWPGVGDCESNCVTYNAERDTFIYSFYTNNSIVEVDRSTGATLWWAGEVPGGFTVDPPDAMFHWQHGLVWTDTGSLLLSTHADDSFRPNVYAREYDVDIEAGVLRQLWWYDAGTPVDTNGDTHRLANGRTLHALGSAGRVQEVDADGVIVWQLAFPGNHLVGRVEPIPDLYALVAPAAR